MIDRAREEAQRFFDGLWAQGDYWALETSAYDRARYRRYLELLRDRHYRRGLEIGAGAGAFTRLLAPEVGQLVALEVSEQAIERGRVDGWPTNVDCRAVNVIDFEVSAEGPWDLVVVSETVYYLGWLHTVFDLFWLASELHEAVRAGGRLLLGNTYMGASIMDERLIRTYCDLFRNVGFEVEHEEVLAGEKEGTKVESLVTLFRKPAGR
jgi:SAM-dependent methyltransferase